MKQRPKPCQQPLQLRVWMAPAWCFCCIYSAQGCGGGGPGPPSWFLSSGCGWRSCKPQLSLVSLNLGHEVVSKQETKLAYWMPYKPSVLGIRRDPQGQPKGSRCSWGQGLFLFFQAGLKSTSSTCIKSCRPGGTGQWYCLHLWGVPGIQRLGLWDLKGDQIRASLGRGVVSGLLGWDCIESGYRAALGVAGPWATREIFVENRWYWIGLRGV